MQASGLRVVLDVPDPLEGQPRPPAPLAKPVHTVSRLGEPGTNLRDEKGAIRLRQGDGTRCVEDLETDAVGALQAPAPSRYDLAGDEVDEVTGPSTTAEGRAALRHVVALRTIGSPS